ncbi:IS4 family transposase [Cohnella cellulosilytica]|uniref:IS4 family transposase n=1 Tax=Cohnella cellulosilytica TaxID=986710 RepID=UPI00361A20AD
MSQSTSLEQEDWASTELQHLGIKCGRTIKRFIQTVSTLTQNLGKSLAGASRDSAEAKAMYRLLDNEQITEEVVLQAHRKATLGHMKAQGESIILAVQDTTTVNYTSLQQTEGLGDIGGAIGNRGLIVHSSLAVRPNGIALGLLDQMIWTRKPEERGKRNDRSPRPIEEKESYKWLKSMDNSSAGIPEGIRLVHVGDREADVYEFFDHALASEQEFLVRVVQNRLTLEADKLFDGVKQEPSCGQIVVEIPRDTRRNLPEREATLDIRYGRAQVKVPANLPNKWLNSRSASLSIVYVRELNPPAGVEPIAWYLVTSLAVESLEEAVEKINWYMQRWKIERFHYILKSGCAIEKLQNRTAERLQKLILIYSLISVRILGMTYLARQLPEACCTLYLEEEEWKVLYCIAHRTSTAPPTPPTIQTAVLCLAKLGGFLGRKGDGDPGVKVLWRGLNELHTVLKHRRYTSF